MTNIVKRSQCQAAIELERAWAISSLIANRGVIKVIQNFLWVLLGCGIMVGIVIIWFVIYYLLNPSVKDPDGHAKITGKCGDTMEISLKFDGGKMKDASCWTDGCAYSYNSVCAAADLAKGKTPDEILKIDAEAIQEYIGGLPSDHLHCAKLAEETLQAALNDYMVKLRAQDKGSEEKTRKYCVDT